MSASSMCTRARWMQTRATLKSINGKAYLKSERRVTSLMWPWGFTQVGSHQYKQSTSAGFRGERFALKCVAPRPNQRLLMYSFTERQSRPEVCVYSSRLHTSNLRLPLIPSLQFKMTLLPVCFRFTLMCNTLFYTSCLCYFFCSLPRALITFIWP